MALVGMSIGLSFAVALVLGPAVAAAGGLSAVFWLTAVLAVLGVVIVITLVPTPPEASGGHEDVGARAGLIGRTLRDLPLVRLNFGVFTLHFILMALFLLVPGFLEQTAGIDRTRHWLVYLPILVLSIAGMVPLMILAERGGRPRQMFLLGIALVLVAIGLLGFSSMPQVFYFALWLFFVGFNYLEATLPSLVSKMVFAGGKGTAMGVYSTCQFLGAFAGGALGGWCLQQWGIAAMVSLCLFLAAVWWLVALPMSMPTLPESGELSDARADQSPSP